MPVKVQVVVYSSEYGTNIYTNQDEVKDIVDIEVIDFDVTEYNDRVPDESDFIYLKQDFDKITIPHAKKAISRWYNENYEALQGILEYERKRKEERTAEKVAREEQEVKDAIALLESKGIKV